MAKTAVGFQEQVYKEPPSNAVIISEQYLKSVAELVVFRDSARDVGIHENYSEYV